MGYIVSICILFFAIVLHYSRKTWVDPDTIFCYMWGVISLLSSLHLFSMYETSTKTWCIIALGTFMFCIGVSFGKRIRMGSNDEILELGTEKNYYARSQMIFFGDKFFWIIAISMILLSLPDLIQSILLMRQGVSLSIIREASYGIVEVEGYVHKYGAFYQLFAIVKSVLEILIVATAIESFIYDMRRGYKKLFVVVLIEIMVSFTFGGRFSFAYFIIEIMVCFGIYKKSGNRNEVSITQKTKRWIIRIVFIMALLIIALSIVRGAEMSQLISKYYRYLCGNIKFFDLHVSQLDNNGFWSMGFAAIYGLWKTILPFFDLIGFHYPNLYLESISHVMNTQTFLKIGDSMSTNAFITPFYHLYADFRWFGVIFGMMFFGILAAKYFFKAKRTMSPMYITCYLIIVQMIFKSIQMYPLVSDTYVFVLFTMIFVVSRKKRRLLKRL